MVVNANVMRTELREMKRHITFQLKDFNGLESYGDLIIDGEIRLGYKGLDGLFNSIFISCPSNKQTPWPLVCKITVRLSDRHLVTKLSANFCGKRGQRGGSPTAVNLSFLERSRYISLK
jgi:hypothetical protein